MFIFWPINITAALSHNRPLGLRAFSRAGQFRAGGCKKAASRAAHKEKSAISGCLGCETPAKGRGDSPVLIGGGFRLPPEWTVRVSYLRRRPRVGVAILILLAPVAVQLCLDRLGYFPQIFRVGTVPCPNGSHRLPQNGASD